jgi:general stress protein YciG
MKRINPDIIAEVSRMLGAQGGHAAAKAMSKKERIERARKAGQASAVVRWGSPKKKMGGK